MATLNVQFSDASKTTIVAYFSCPQDEEAYPNSGTIESGDPIWAKFYNSASVVAEYLPAPLVTQS